MLQEAITGMMFFACFLFFSDYKANYSQVKIAERQFDFDYYCFRKERMSNYVEQYLNYRNRSMERRSWETTVLPLVYQLDRLRQQYPLFHLIVLIIEMGFITLPLFRHFQNQADPLFVTFANAYRDYFAQTEAVTNTIGYLSLIFVVILLAAAGMILVQMKWSQGNYLNSNSLERFNSAMVATYFIAETLLLPSFILTINNLRNLINQPIRNLNIVVLPFLLIFIISDRQRRLFKWKLLLLGCIELGLGGWIRSTAWAYISLRLAMQQDHRFQKVIYWLIAYWQVLCLSLIFFEQTVNSFSLIITLLIISGIVLALPRPLQIKNVEDQNDYLLKMQKKQKDGEQLTYDEKMNIALIGQIFRQQLSIDQQINISNQIEFDDISQKATHQQLMTLLHIKLSVECQRDHNNLLRIQQIYCQLARNAFSLQTLYDIQILVKKMQAESSLNQRFRLFDLITYVERQFLKRQENANASVIIRVEKQIQKFYSRIMGVTAIMLHFWTLHSKNRLNQDTMSGLFEQVLRMEQEMKKDIELISIHGNARKQRIILSSLMKLTSNNHVLTTESKNESVGLGGTNYLLIQQSKVLDISSQIINQLNISKQEISNLTTEDVFPKLVCRYINDHLDSLVQRQLEHQEESIVLPVRVSRNRSYIVPFHARLQILPQLMNGIKFLVHFLESSNIQNTPSMLYSPSLDRIHLISPNFSTHFSLVNEPYLYEQFAHEIFGIDLIHIFQSQAKEGEPVYCELTLKNHSVKGEPISRKRSRAVVLKVVASYQVGNEQLLLVQVFKKEDFDHPGQCRISFNELLYGGEESPSQEKRNRQKDINETFCRIANPYENVIDQKLSKMKDFYRISYLKIILMLFILILIATLGANVLLSLRIDQTAQQLITTFNDNIDKNSQITYTYLLFSQSSILHQLITYPQQFLQMAKYDIKAQIADYKHKVSYDVQVLRELQLRNVIRDNRTYKLQFDHFNITTSTKATNMYDFMMFAKQSIVTGNIAPLVLNWPVISTIISSYTPFSLQNLDGFLTFQLWVFLLSLTLILAALLCVNIVALRIRCLIGRILTLYEGVNEGSCTHFIQKYQQFASILYTCNYFRSSHKRRQMQTARNLNNQNANTTLLDLKDSIQAQINLQLCDSNIDISSALAQKMKPIPRSSMFIFLCQQNLICWFPLVVVGFFMSYYLQMQKYQLEATNILTYSDQMQKSCSFISYHASNFLMSSLQETLPQSQRLQVPLLLTRNIITEFTADLPAYFEEYKRTQEQMLSHDLCTFAFLNTGSLYRDIVCKDILNGIMTRGFAQTMAMYVDLISTKVGLQMGNFQNIKRTGGKYPVFMEVYYIRRTVYNLVVYLQTIFDNKALVYIGNWNRFLKFILNLGWLLFPLFIILGSYYFSKAYKRCKLGLKCFLVLPRSFLLQMKMTKILRQKEILSQIEWLAL